MTYGMGEGADVRAVDIERQAGRTRFRVLRKGAWMTWTSP